eukprot:478885-Rhodomonas_salina.3
MKASSWRQAISRCNQVQPSPSTHHTTRHTKDKGRFAIAVSFRNFFCTGPSVRSGLACPSQCPTHTLLPHTPWPQLIQSCEQPPMMRTEESAQPA